MQTKSAELAERRGFQAELFLVGGGLLMQTELPAGSPPDVIFCGARAFRRVLRVRGGLQYVECTCWRVEEPVVAESQAHGS
jgi:hypothetical protein